MKWQTGYPMKPEAGVQEPCRSYVLRDVICVYCNHCTDLDLCRGPCPPGQPSPLAPMMHLGR